MWTKLISEDLLWVDLILKYEIVSNLDMGLHMGSHKLARPPGRQKLEFYHFKSFAADFMWTKLISEDLL